MIMMNKKRICIFLALILVFAAGIILVRLTSAPEEDSQKEMVLIREDREGEEEDAASTLPASGENREQRYYLVVEDGYLSVYYGADRTFYAYTDIRYDMLDEETRQQIQQGLSFTDERTLYDFLENHSS